MQKYAPKEKLAMWSAVGLIILASAITAPSGDFFWPNFWVFIACQLTPIAIFSVIRPTRPAIVTGGAFAILATFVMNFLWETHWHKGPNSMPFFAYIFFFLPLACIGILIGRYLAVKRYFERQIVSGLTVFFFGTAMGTLITFPAFLRQFKNIW